MKELVTSSHFVNLVKLPYQTSKQLIDRNHLKREVINGKPLYLKSEIEALAAYYITGMVKPGEHELTIAQIGTLFDLDYALARKLVNCEGFPKPVRNYINFNGGRPCFVWLRKDVEGLDHLQLLCRTNVRKWKKVDTKEPFSWSGLQAEIIHFCVGDFSMEMKLGAQ